MIKKTENLFYKLHLKCNFNFRKHITYIFFLRDCSHRDPEGSSYNRRKA